MPRPSSVSMFDDWVDVGFSMVYSGHFTYNTTTRMVNQWALPHLADRNIQVIIEDTRIDAPGSGETIPADYAARVQAVLTDYGSYPAFFGVKLADEANATWFQNVYDCAHIACANMPDHQIMCNYFPWYSWSGAYYQYSNFQDFMADMLGLHQASCMEILSADCYFQMDTMANPENGTWDTFFDSMYRYGNWCRTNDQDFWHIVLGTPHTPEKPDGTPRFNYELPNEASLRWQFNCSVAYGADGVFYYTFYTPNLPEFRSGAIAVDGTKTPIYYWMKNTHSRFRSFYGDLFMDLVLVDIWHVGQSFGMETPLLTDDILVHSVTAHGGSVDHPFVVSKFVNGDPQDTGQYIMIVNNTYDDAAQTTARLVLRDPNAIIYRYESAGGPTLLGDINRAADTCSVDIVLDTGREVLYRIEKQPICGDPGTELDGDIFGDCKVDLNDVAVLAHDWAQCTDPADSDCDQFWKTALILYDDFDDPVASQSKWQIVETLDEFVTFDGSQAILNLQEPTTPGNYESKIIANDLAFILNHVGDSFRITWDMQRNPDIFDLNAWVNGICLGNDSAHMWYGGQYGLMNGTSDYRVGSLGMSDGWGGTDFDYFEYHHEAYAEVLSYDAGYVNISTEYQAFNHIPAYDDSPELYKLNETPVTELSVESSISFPQNQPIGVRFYMNNPFGSDSQGHMRGEIFVDNVYYTNFTNPSSCGQYGTVYLLGDINTDCRVDLLDLSELLTSWLEDSNPNQI